MEQNDISIGYHEIYIKCDGRFYKAEKGRVFNESIKKTGENPPVFMIEVLNSFPISLMNQKVDSIHVYRDENLQSCVLFDGIIRCTVVSMVVDWGGSGTMTYLVEYSTRREVDMSSSDFVIDPLEPPALFNENIGDNDE